jgi:DNA-binding CsgD family transcriptional regulator
MLVARDEQLAELLASVSTPDSSILLIGRRGSGRSRLLREVQKLSPVRAVTISPIRSERHTPLSGLSLILSGVKDVRLAEFVGRFSLADDSTAGTIAAAQDLLHIVRRLELDPIAIVVDDIDLLDDQSQAVISFMASRMTGTGIRLVAAAGVLGTDSALQAIPSVELPSLTLQQSVELGARVRPAVDSQTLRIVAESAGGLPGMMLQTLDHLSADQLAGVAALSLPLRPLDGSGLDELSNDSDARAALEIVSTAPVHSVGAVLESAHIDRAQLEQLAAMGLLDMSGRFVRLRDGSLRSALYWGMSLAERRELHAAAADSEAIYGTVLSAWHLDHIEAAPRSAGALLRGANWLLHSELVPSSIEFAERALLSDADPESFLEDLLDYCLALVDRGEFGLAGRYLSRAREYAVHDRQILRWKSIEVTAHALSGERIDENEVDVCVQRYSFTCPEGCAELLDTVAMFLAEEGDVDAARRRTQLADELLADSAATPLELRHWAPRLVESINGEGMSQLTPAASDLEGMPLSALLACGHSLSMEEDYEHARQALTMLTMSLPQQRQRSAWLAPALALTASNEQRAGHYHEANLALDRLVASGAHPDFRGLLMLAWRAQLMDEAAGAVPFLDELRYRTRHSRHETAVASLASIDGSAALMRGDVDKAIVALGHAFNAAPDLRPGVLRVEHDYVEALHLAGDDARAHRVVETFAARHERRPSRWSAAALARSRATIAEEPDIVAAFERALELAAGTNSPYELARTHLGFSTALQRVGRIEQAREERRASRFLFETAYAPGWMRLAHSEPNDLQQPPVNSMLATLTDDELAVLRLIRRGVRNKDIAASLFVSLRTVEVRITQIYRKLEARSRSHLLALLPMDADLLEPH